MHFYVKSKRCLGFQPKSCEKIHLYLVIHLQSANSPHPGNNVHNISGTQYGLIMVLCSLYGDSAHIHADGCDLLTCFGWTIILTFPLQDIFGMVCQ